MNNGSQSSSRDQQQAQHPQQQMHLVDPMMYQYYQQGPTSSSVPQLPQAAVPQVAPPSSLPLQMEPPSFSDLMREISYEQSDALHAAARQVSQQPGIIPSTNYNLQPGSSSARTSNVGPIRRRLRGDPAARSSSLTPMPPVQTSGSTGWHLAVPASADETSFEMFPCEYCSASFSRRHDLERHKRGHSGEAPYMCQGCGAKFTRSDGRGRHWKLQPDCEQRHFQFGGGGRRRGASGSGSSSGGAASMRGRSTSSHSSPQA